MAIYKPGGRKLPVPDSWQDLIDEYVLAEKAVGRPQTTIQTRVSHIARVARDFSTTEPDAVNGPTLVRWFGRQEQWSNETRRSYRNSVRSFFGWAVAAGVMDENPALLLRPVPAKKAKAKPAPDRVWNESVMAADARELVMLHLACHAGMRRGEVALVRTQDLYESFDGWVITAHGKGGKDRDIPIDDDLASLVMAGAAGHTAGASPTGWLFPGDENGHLSPRWVGTLCSRVMPDVWTMHKLRHRYATKALRGTGNLRAVQELLGHESVATTEIYTEVGDAERRAAAEAASGFRSSSHAMPRNMAS